MNSNFTSKIFRLLVGVFTLALASACSLQPAPTASPSPTGPRTIRVMTHDSFSISEGVLAQFENENNTKVQFLKSGDTGTALNKAILSKDKPLADVFYGVDNTFLSRALDEGIFIPYASPRLADIPEAFKLDTQNRALPVDYGDVCLNYDRAYFTQHNLKPPQTLDDLLKAEYKGLLIEENPATSSPGLAFLLATIGVKGDPGYLDYWKGLVENDVLVVNDWETAYYTEFSGSSGKGPRPMVISYNSSPVFELIYAGTPLDEPPTVAVVDDDTCFRQIEFVGILQGGQNQDLAEKWVDFMLSTAFQEDLPMQMFVFPVNLAAKLDEAFVKYLQIPKKTASVSPQEIAANREQWLKAWTEAVLR
ncbi:MAG: ABC transporter substrate-binding protein [Chloroflexi bacterium RBG_16_57_11]|nr:MAG: ABC transporter substrate-binding protein [Chloroflexi bacterium RBG_16_57_11]